MRPVFDCPDVELSRSRAESRVCDASVPRPGRYRTFHAEFCVILGCQGPRANKDL